MCALINSDFPSRQLLTRCKVGGFGLLDHLCHRNTVILANARFLLVRPEDRLTRVETLSRLCKLEVALPRLSRSGIAPILAPSGCCQAKPCFFFSRVVQPFRPGPGPVWLDIDIVVLWGLSLAMRYQSGRRVQPLFASVRQVQRYL